MFVYPDPMVVVFITAWKANSHKAFIHESFYRGWLGVCPVDDVRANAGSLELVPRHIKQAGLAPHTYSPIPRKVEAGGSQVEKHPGLSSILGLHPCLMGKTIALP